VSVHALIWLPVAGSALLGALAPRLGRWLPPATAVRALSAAALVSALGTGFVLAVAGFVVLAQVPVVAALGHWSAAVVATGHLVPVAAGGLAGLTVTVLLASALCRVLRAGRELTVAALVCRRLGRGVGGLVVVEDEVPEAFALPGLGGRVVVSTAMLAALPADERAVLLAHEAAHLAHRHHLYVQAVELAAAANPLLRPVARAVRAAVERWADEVAAAQVGDRALAARALARAGLARARASRAARSRLAVTGALGGAALGGAQTQVADRARALLAPPVPPRRALAGAVLSLTVASGAVVVLSEHLTETRFELAHASYGHPRHPLRYGGAVRVLERDAAAWARRVLT